MLLLQKWPMLEKPKDRLRQARENAGYGSPTEAAREHSREMNQNTLISHENGNRDISRKAAIKYGRVFGVDPGWILYGDQSSPEKMPTEIPVLTMVSASNLAEAQSITRDMVENWVHLYGLPKGDWVALLVDGDSMDRTAPAGSLIIVNRSDQKLLNNRLYVFVTENGAATFKRYMRNPERMQPYSNNPDHPTIPFTDDIYVFGRVRKVIIDV